MLLVVALLVSIIVYYNQTKGSADLVTIPLEEVIGEEQIEEEQVSYFAPLTGLPVEEEANNRIIGVMINNLKPARPQSGLDKADMVYEIYAEGMITRFIAFYQSQQPEVIGPVRSTRPYYIEIINGFDGVIVHCGASFTAYDILRSNSLPYLDEITNSGGTFWRASFRQAPHNVYTSYNKIIASMKSKDYRETGYIPSFIFLDESKENEGLPATSINIAYHTDYHPSYEYNIEDKLYYRYIDGVAHTDLETNQQLTAKNILVVKTTHKVLDSAGRLEVNVYGPGEGYLFQNGKVKEVTWERKDGVIRAYIGGVEQGLYPGQTWVMVVDNLTPVSYQ